MISKGFINRGIFVLKEDEDIVHNKSKISLKINDDWVELGENDKIFIKPFYKTENLKKWFVEDTKLYLIYVGNRILTKTIKEYLFQFVNILINRATIVEDKIISFKEFEAYTENDIKKVYSSAGAVQKIMKRKMWYSPLYERSNVPFDENKIVVNTKNMDVFTFSNRAVYSSGGGAGGQNFIYHKKDSPHFKNSNPNLPAIYTKFICAVLNSKLIQFYIQGGQYNQLSTSKIGDLPIPKIDFTVGNSLFEAICTKADLLIVHSSDSRNKVSSEIIMAEKKIDNLVYKLYNIPYNEIKVIDPGFSLTEDEYDSIKIN